MRNDRLSLFMSLGLCVLASVTHAASQDELLKGYFWNEVKSLPPDQRPKVALVLGGGGARGLAHIGVIKVLEREGIPIDIVAGTSVGAIVGSLYAAGVPVSEMEKMADEIGWNKISDVSRTALVKLVLTEKLLSNERMEDYLRKYMGHKRFDELHIPFACVATDIQTGEKIVFQEGEVAPAVRASATIPGVFKAMQYRHRYLVDGGIIDNIPTDAAKNLGADIVIVSAVRSEFREYGNSNVLMTLGQSITIMGGEMAQDKLKTADVAIQPYVGDVTMTQFWRGPECLRAGIIAAQKMIPRIKDVITDRVYERLLTGVPAGRT